MKKQIFEYPKNNKELINKFLLFKDSSGGYNKSDIIFFFSDGFAYSFRRKRIVNFKKWIPGYKFEKYGWNVFIF